MKIFIGIWFTCFSFSAFTQVLDKSYFKFNVDTIDLSTSEKINTKKEFLINCMDYYLNTRIGDLSIAKMKCFEVFLKLCSNNDFSLGLVKFYPSKLIRGANGAYRYIYEIGQTKLKLENKDLFNNDTILLRKSVAFFLEYCSNDKQIHLSKERKRALEFREKGELDLYIDELIRKNKSLQTSPVFVISKNEKN